MRSKPGYLVVLLGVVLTTGGLHQTYLTIETTELVLLWGSVVIVGAFVIAIGMAKLDPVYESTIDPRDGVDVPELRFGRR